MKSPTSVKLTTFAQADLAYRRLRDDIAAIETSLPADSENAALVASMRRVLVQAVLADRYVGVYIDGSLEEAAAVSYTPVSTLADLHTIVRGNLKGKFQLTADIDATADCLLGGAYYNGGEGWEPIGTIDGGEGGDPNSGFQGIFDGNGHKITGLKCVRPTEDYQGLFGFIGTGGTVKNLEMAAVTISGRSQLGGICGGAFGLVYNCHTTGASSVVGNYTSLAYSGNVGGIIGDNDGVVRLCSAAGTVRGLRDVGGISGDNDGLLMYSWFTGDVYVSVLGDSGLISGDNKGFIENIPMADMPVNKGTIYGCYGVGTVSSFDIAEIGSPAPTGNIALGVGDNRGGKVSSSWASGSVTGKNPDVAGFVGNNDLGDNNAGETKDSIVSNCYAIATVTPLGALPAEGTAAGFVGKNKGGQVYNCFSASTVVIGGGVSREHTGDFCGNNSNTSLVGVISLSYYDETIALLGISDGGTPKTTAELHQQATFEGWDFGSVWSIVEGVSYPTLPEMPEASDSETGFVDVFPIQRIGVLPLTGDVRPKIVPSHVIFAEKCEDDIVRTPIIVEDKNFPVGRTDITGGAVGKNALGDKAGGDIAGKGLDWDVNENIDVQVNNTNIQINGSNQLSIVDKSIGESKLSDILESSTIHFNADDALSVVDASIGKEKLGDVNGDDILGVGLDWNAVTEKIDVDLSEAMGLGVGLDWDGTDIVVDLSEVVSIQSSSIEADSAPQANNDWYTVLEKSVTAAIGKDLQISLFVTLKGTSGGCKFNVQICIGTSGAVGDTVVEGRYEWGDNTSTLAVNVVVENIAAADPYIRVQIKNNDYTADQMIVNGADHKGQFTVIVS